MQQPMGFVVSGKEDYVCLLKKSLYGLKQSPRQWYMRVGLFMISHNFRRCTYDSCVYFRRCDDEPFVYLLLYVDDMFIAAKDKEEIQRVKAKLSKEIEMKDLGTTKNILRMDILRDRHAGKLYLSKKWYIEKFFIDSTCKFPSLLMHH